MHSALLGTLFNLTQSVKQDSIIGQGVIVSKQRGSCRFHVCSCHNEKKEKNPFNN